MKSIRNFMFNILCVCFLFNFVSCKKEEDIAKEWTTQYTIEEHVQRISARTEEKFASEIENGEIVNYEVEIVYCYSEKPKYFLVNLEYAEEVTITAEDMHLSDQEKERLADKLPLVTKYRHILGFISNDDYYTGFINYINGFKWGRSPWDYCGYKGYKKYYNFYSYAIALDGILTRIYSSTTYNPIGYNEYENFEKRTITEVEIAKAESEENDKPGILHKKY